MLNSRQDILIFVMSLSLYFFSFSSYTCQWVSWGSNKLIYALLRNITPWRSHFMLDLASCGSLIILVMPFPRAFTYHIILQMWWEKMKLISFSFFPDFAGRPPQTSLKFFFALWKVANMSSFVWQFVGEMITISLFNNWRKKSIEILVCVVFELSLCFL